MESLKKIRFLNGNTIKLIAAISMFLDHFGILFFPKTLWFRVLGRFAMPIYAFAIAEGCRYTKNKRKHFLLLFGLGAVCQIVYTIFDPKHLYFGILITFSFSTLMIYALQYAKKCTFDKDTGIFLKIVSWLLFFALVVCTYLFCERFAVDYGFYGSMMPVFASLFDFHRIPAPDFLKKLDVLPLRVLCMAIPLAPLALANLGVGALPVWVRVHALLAILLLLFYNGDKGKANMKYFFYIFYPLHLALLEGVVIAIHLFF